MVYMHMVCIHMVCMHMVCMHMVCMHMVVCMHIAAMAPLAPFACLSSLRSLPPAPAPYADVTLASTLPMSRTRPPPPPPPVLSSSLYCAPCSSTLYLRLALQMTALADSQTTWARRRSFASGLARNSILGGGLGCVATVALPNDSCEPMLACQRPWLQLFPPQRCLYFSPGILSARTPSLMHTHSHAHPLSCTATLMCIHSHSHFGSPSALHALPRPLVPSFTAGH